MTEIRTLTVEERAELLARPAGLGLAYLATPYTKFPGGIHAAFVEAAKLAARLMVKGIKVYSPIAHTHPLAIHGNLDPTDLHIWLPFDEAMMDKADVLIVARMEVEMRDLVLDSFRGLPALVSVSGCMSKIGLPAAW